MCWTTKRDKWRLSGTLLNPGELNEEASAFHEGVHRAQEWRASHYPRASDAASVLG